MQLWVKLYADAHWSILSKNRPERGWKYYFEFLIKNFIHNDHSVCDHLFLEFPTSMHSTNQTGDSTPQKTMALPTLDNLQFFLLELDMKPHMHLVEIRICSPNQVIVRPTKIINNVLNHCKILIFKVIIRHWKSVQYF